MKTNENGHTLRNLTNRVMAVIDDAEHAREAVETLERAGVPQRELTNLSGPEGMNRIDAGGVRSGGLKQALRALQRFTVEGNHLRRYEAELATGHHVIDVHARGYMQRESIARILRSHGAHFINAYGACTIETVTA